MQESFEVHAVCPNPMCRERELAVLTGLETADKAFEAKKVLEGGRSRTGILSVYFPQAIKKLSPASPALPDYLECQSCHTVFPYQGTTFLVARVPEPRLSVADSVHV